MPFVEGLMLETLLIFSKRRPRSKVLFHDLCVSTIEKEYTGNKVVMSYTLISFPESLMRRGHGNKVSISNTYLGGIINLASFVD